MFCYIIVSGSLKGHVLYDDEYDACRAAEAASARDGRVWEPRWIWVEE